MSGATEPIYPGATMGILGSGQLGRMLALSARQMGYRVATLSPESNSPTGQIADQEVVADYDDVPAVEAFAQSVDIVTFEFENVSAQATEAAARFAPVRPGGGVLHTTQHRLREKTFLQSHGFPVTSFQVVRTSDELDAAIIAVGLPGVLKTAGFGYDGKGQRIVRTRDEATQAFAELGGTGCILERWVDFAGEISVVAARSVSGEFAAYPAVLNEHAHHILDVTIAPAPNLPPDLTRDAYAITRGILEALNVVGVLCVEFFVTTGGTLLVNELAPRPHNSGHWTIEGAECSQFEQQLRAVCGLPLGSTALRRPEKTVAMANLLGDVWERGTPNFSALLALPDVHLHLYGKAVPRPGRKMGHLTSFAPTPEAAAARVRAARAVLSNVSPEPNV